MSDSSELHMDKTAFSVVSLHDAKRDDFEYWLSKTPLERLRGIEMIRQALYGYSPDTERFQRVFSVAKFEKR
jgi:hypothetical protein